MKTKMDRLPVSFVEYADQEAKRKNVPRTYVYKTIEEVLKGVEPKERRKDEKYPFHI